MPHAATDIAKWMIARARQEGEFLTPMKLQKLIYIAHGWNLGLEQGPLIVEPVEAWPYGPVIRSVYDEYRDFGASPIELDVHPPRNIDRQDNEILNWVWNGYRQFSAAQLSDMTHQKGTPWAKSYTPQTRALIPPEMIKAHYKEKLLAHGQPQSSK